ncbi:uncharacterized protein K444DRAFT_172372 [Hyaloscypha bicolor E]|uniref:Zn(2)-C6 fungal-type domain-containing protein n=1 Tax=Hyaloscypha bicolor E TaxID=1095630 RepID=A0A2J6SR81_9HELO|nr:uncharacterized protein K444DRAFT_172372 [Hyaloscypha bicolor E]PMD53284.1 hypothetical protein K444DRAFT_172372 [Hyaloscypha bicolor E]
MESTFRLPAPTSHGPREYAPRYTSDEWEDMKPKIERLYVLEQKTLQEVTHALEHEYGFTPTEKQLKSRLTKWRFDIKNVKGDVMVQIARVRVKRKREDDKDSGFRVDKKPVAERNINRYLKRNNVTEEDLLSMPSPSDAPSPAFSVFTPGPDSPSNTCLQTVSSSVKIFATRPCGNCKSRKMKCDKTLPKCSPCTRFFWQDLLCNCSPVRKLAVFHNQLSRSSLDGTSYQSAELSLSHLLNSATTTTASSDSSTPFHMFGLRQGGLNHYGDVFPGALPGTIQDRPDSPEVLFSRFREQICPMLSITSGENNMWQTLILPRMRSSESLPHAISAITALHVSTLIADVQLHNHGAASIIHSLRILSNELSRPGFEISALATVLLLASWARWNDSFREGKTHLKGAFAIVLKIVSTLFYMDALSDLVQSTISEENPRTCLKFRGFMRPFPPNWETHPCSVLLDPWISYSLTFVELIYAAADLCYEVRMATVTTSDIITKAEALKRKVGRYSHDTSYLSTTTVHLSALDKQYVVHTAEAYRYAILLFLHQVMPDIFGMASSQCLARTTVKHLSRSPPSCSVTFTQIYPLFVAGCEANNKEERDWAKERWVAMLAHMRVTNVSKCWEITQEVWKRRDAYRQQRMQGVADTVDNKDPEFSVKGRLHWAAVMKDWDCEVSF